MGELALIRRAAGQALATATPAALCTVMAVEGSYYRRPGARMLIAAGRSTGVLSGGCLDQELATLAASVTESEPRVRVATYDLGDEADVYLGYGSGCPGRVTIMVEDLDTIAAAGDLNRALLEPGAGIKGIATIIASNVTGLGAGARLSVTGGGLVGHEVERWPVEVQRKLHAACAQAPVQSPALVDVGGIRVLVEAPFLPIGLHIVGAGDDGMALGAQATLLGWNLTVYDHRPHLLQSARFPGAAALIPLTSDPETFAAASPLPSFGARDALVLMTHHLLRDLAALRWLAAQGARPTYLGVLGAARRAALLKSELAKDPGHDPEFLAAIRGPAGLGILGRGPDAAGIALSVVAEIMTVLP